MSTLRAITTPTRAASLQPGSYGWLPLAPDTPEPIQRGDKVNLVPDARLVPSVLPADPAAHRVIRNLDGSYTLETVPGTTIRRALSTPWDRDSAGLRIHFTHVTPANRATHALHLLRDAVRHGKVISFAKEAALGAADAVRFHLAR